MWRSAGSAATVALASGSVAVWVLCPQSRDCGTTAAPKVQAPSLTSGRAASAPPAQPNLLPLSLPPARVGRRDSPEPGPLSPPHLRPPLPFMVPTSLPSLQPPRPHPGLPRLDPRPASARLSPPLRSSPVPSSPSAALLSRPPSRPLPSPTGWVRSDLARVPPPPALGPTRSGSAPPLRR